MKIIYKLKRSIEDVSKESIFLIINGDVIDFVNLKQTSEQINKINTFVYSFEKYTLNQNQNEGSQKKEINFSLIYKRENFTSINSFENLIEINEISVTNTLIGGNYKCVPCKNVRN